MVDAATEYEIERIELKLLLAAVNDRYGYDFSEYAESSIRRRVRLTMKQQGYRTVSELTHQVLVDKTAFEYLFLNFSVNVTEMFRDPGAYRVIRKRVIPELAALKHIKVWHAGCATGEEVYSVAIMLEESGLYDCTWIYATDINEMILKKAREGIYKSDCFREYTRNYHLSGGNEPFSDYYTADSGYAIMADSLKRNILFSDHNLVTDSVFGEMTLIVCRNVMIYFNRNLQNRVIKLFTESLAPGGYLWIGKKESIRFSDVKNSFEAIDNDEKIYRKIA